MGDQVAELTYGVMLSEADYKKIESILYEERESKSSYQCQSYVNGKWVTETHINKSLYEKDEKSLLILEQPYETEDYLLIVRKSRQSSFNGTEPVKDFNFLDYNLWNTELNKFIIENNLNPETLIGWLLTAHYG